MQSLVPCTNNCDFQSLLALVNNIFTFILKVSLPLAALAITIGGIMIVFNPGDTSKRQTALAIIRTTVIGLVLMLAAYLIVHTILDYFIDDSLRGSIGI
jgi:RsiW-degrading membrane proteinase PrsW (M82 family)